MNCKKKDCVNRIYCKKCDSCLAFSNYETGEERDEYYKNALLKSDDNDSYVAEMLDNTGSLK